MVLDGPMNGTTFLAYVPQVLVQPIRQRRLGARCNRGSQRAMTLPSALRLRLQPDRERLRQAEGAERGVEVLLFDNRCRWVCVYCTFAPNGVNERMRLLSSLLTSRASCESRRTRGVRNTKSSVRVESLPLTPKREPTTGMRRNAGMP